MKCSYQELWARVRHLAKIELDCETSPKDEFVTAVVVVMTTSGYSHVWLQSEITNDIEAALKRLVHDIETRKIPNEWYKDERPGKTKSAKPVKAVK